MGCMFIANSNIKTSDIISDKLQRVRQLFAELVAAGVMPLGGRAYNYHILLGVVNFVDAIQPVVELLAFAPWYVCKNCVTLLGYKFKLISANFAEIRMLFLRNGSFFVSFYKNIKNNIFVKCILQKC